MMSTIISTHRAMQQPLCRTLGLLVSGVESCGKAQNNDHLPGEVAITASSLSRGGPASMELLPPAAVYTPPVHSLGCGDRTMSPPQWPASDDAGRARQGQRCAAAGPCAPPLSPIQAPHMTSTEGRQPGDDCQTTSHLVELPRGSCVCH
ncbi:hypothetical protein P4O66_011522 [Electrophorus voltai]|uniref:Uncharacterized protein n=1 Tax=Electrophorus voltai TaxID=2609070 RepID=A0AAD8Z4R3_9TELE|nr:hypothetical protein P4O66_011522 [Electrophorus voltai]